MRSLLGVKNTAKVGKGKKPISGLGPEKRDRDVTGEAVERKRQKAVAQQEAVLDDLSSEDPLDDSDDPESGCDLSGSAQAVTEAVEAESSGSERIDEDLGIIDEAGTSEQDEDEPTTSGRQGQDSMAQAFAEIMRHPGSSQKDIVAPILLGSKSLAKRRREEAEALSVQQRSKHLRQKISQRVHKKVAKKGEDTEQDAAEKVLQKIATRGVIQLFNAVSKAQQARKDKLAAGAKEKEAKINKSDFFSELKRSVAEAQAGPKTASTRQTGPDEASAPGWDVLRPEFAGLQGRTAVKMKDWDKALPAEFSLEDPTQMASDEASDAEFSEGQ